MGSPQRHGYAEILNFKFPLRVLRLRAKYIPTVMELRKHPRMTCLGKPNWPPEWKGPYGPNNPLPSGEVGTLIRVEPASSNPETPHCFVVIHLNKQEYFGSLYFDEEDSLTEIVKLLRSCLGRPIAEIGSLDIP